MKPWPRWLFYLCLFAVLLTLFEVIDGRESKVLMLAGWVFAGIAWFFRVIS